MVLLLKSGQRIGLGEIRQAKTDDGRVYTAHSAAKRNISTQYSGDSKTFVPWQRL